MPLMKVNVVKGRTDAQKSALLEAVHRAMVDSFKVPEKDRFQILLEHEPSNFIVSDIGLGFERTQDFVLVEVSSRPRTQEAKLAFYAALCDELEARCGIRSSDVMISFLINTDEDWSIGGGRAQLLNGDLKQILMTAAAERDGQGVAA